MQRVGTRYVKVHEEEKQYWLLLAACPVCVSRGFLQRSIDAVYLTQPDSGSMPRSSRLTPAGTVLRDAQDLV